MKKIFSKLKKEKIYSNGSANNEVVKKEETSFDINVSEENDVLKIDISDYISIVDYVERMTLIEEGKYLNVLVNGVLWNSSKQCVNKGSYYVFSIYNKIYNIRVSDDEYKINEREIKDGITEDRFLSYRMTDNNYGYSLLKHDKIGSTFFTKYYSKKFDNYGKLAFTVEETLRDVYHLLLNLSKVKNINDIIDIELLKSMIYYDLVNEAIDDIYYVCEKDDLGSYCFAKYDLEYNTFYDKKISDDCVFLNDVELFVGQKVIIDEINHVYYFSNEIDNDIVNIINKLKESRNKVAEKYMDLEDTIPDNEKIIGEYIESKVSCGEFNDEYLVKVVKLIVKLMGIKVRRRHGGSLYEQRGLDYPDDVYKSIDMLYELIKEKIESLNENDFISLGLSNYGFKDLDYEDFSKELSRRTGYTFNSDHMDKMDSVFYHCNYKRYQELSRMAPNVYIGRDECQYYEDKSDDNAYSEIITRNKCLSLKKIKNN